MAGLAVSLPDWLNIDDPTPSRAVDRVRAAQAAENRKLARTEKTIELTKLFAELPLEQRFWIKALVSNAFNTRKARKALKDRNLPAPESYKVSRWGTQPAFARTRDLCAELALEGVAPSKAALMLRLNEIAEYNIEEVNEFHQGTPTGRRNMRDVGAALKATEMQGRQLQMFGEEKSSVREGPALIVNIISKDDPTKIIDVTPGRVTVAPITPEAIDAESTDGT